MLQQPVLKSQSTTIPIPSITQAMLTTTPKLLLQIAPKKYTGSPVKSMNISSYYTHVDTTAVPAGAKINIYNNTASYFYNKNANETGLTKGVSTSNYSDHYYNKAPNPYKPTATEDYKSGMEVYYEIVLDVSRTIS